MFIETPSLRKKHRGQTGSQHLRIRQSLAGQSNRESLRIRATISRSISRGLLYNMNWARKCKLISLFAGLVLSGCIGAPELAIPDKIGEKERLRVFSGKRAARVVNRMHGQSVATSENAIAEYGDGEKKDILYISRYADPRAAQEAFVQMIEKMVGVPKSPFFHLMPMGKYQKKAYMTLGLGAVHYIYPSGSTLLWFQTFQSFGTTLPPQLLAVYPI